jgi:hypothetical protein
LLGKAVWDSVSGGATFGHGKAEGFIEPARGRYMIDFGSYAEICADGVIFSGLSGRSLLTLRPSSRREGAPLWLLRLLPGTTDARPDGTETLRGTMCRKYAVHVEVARAAAAIGAAGLPAPSGVNATQPPMLGLGVWIDDQHIRQVRFEDGAGGSVAKILTLEIWDYGVLVDGLDWSHLPTFRTPGHGTGT